jgi:hypothetical protein
MHVAEIEDYLLSVAKKLGEIGGTFVEGPLISLDPDEVVGILTASIAFHDKSRLIVALVSSGPQHFPDWLDYSFHYMNAGELCIFRYDSAPHHPNSVFFPHHKHVSADERLEDRPRPSISDLVDEVRSHLYPS